MKEPDHTVLSEDKQHEGQTCLTQDERGLPAGLPEDDKHSERNRQEAGSGLSYQAGRTGDPVSSVQDVPEEKKSLRSEIKKLLRSMDDKDARVASAVIAGKVLSLPELQRANVVFCYVGIDGEVQTRSLIQSLLKSGKKVCVPRCKSGGIMDACYINSLDELKSRPPFGIPEPDSDAEAADPGVIDFAIVPGLAFDRKGNRLGKGAGYYDRYLEKCRAVKCGVCFDIMLKDGVPVDAFDILMDIIVTENSILRIEKSEGSNA